MKCFNLEAIIEWARRLNKMNFYQHQETTMDIKFFTGEKAHKIGHCQPKEKRFYIINMSIPQIFQLQGKE